MNILEEIKNCPVEWKELGEVCEIETGKLNANKSVEDGKYPFFTTAKEISRINSFRWDAEALLIAGNANVGDVKYYSGKFEAYQRTYVLTNFSNNIKARFLLHIIKQGLKSYLENNTNKAAMSYIVISTLKSFPIPIPPLEIQEKIVEKLDKMTEYVTELTSELTSRKKQYSYYRDRLLSFEGMVYQVEWKVLKDVATLKNGKDWKALSSGEIPVYGSGGEIGEFVSDYSYDKPTVLIPRKGSISNLFYLEKAFWNVDTVYYTEIDNKQIIPKYFYYYLTTIRLEEMATNPTRPSLTQTILDKIKIPVPSLEIQSRIVQVLDKFSSLLENTEGLLPKEIEQRQKQYEYYREKLLSFSEANPHTHTHTHTHTLISSEYLALLTKAEKDAGIILIEWKMLGEILDYKQPTKYIVKSKEYNNKFKTPVLTAGKTFILGFTNEEDNIFLASPRNPVIIFDDFTTSNRWIDFSFKVKSSAMKILYMNNTEENNILFKYVYYYMQTINCESKEHGRKWLSHYAKINIPIPPLEIQKEIVDILDKFNTMTNDISEGLPKEIEQRQKQYEYYREKLLSFSRK